MIAANQQRQKPQRRLLFRKLRKQKGTFRVVADAMGVTETTIRLLESGRSRPSTDLMFRLCHYFNCDVYDLWPDLAGERPGQTESRMEGSS